MRASIAAACLIVAAIGAAVLAHAPDMELVPPGGRAVPYLGTVLAWGFVGVGSYAWVRRPDNRTGALMTLTGVGVALSGLQLLASPLLFTIGALLDTVIVALLIQLLLAFPTGRLEGRPERWTVAAAYVAGAMQLPILMVSNCDADGCPENLLQVSDNEALADLFSGLQALIGGVAVVATTVLLLRHWRQASSVQRRGLEPVLLLGAVIGPLGIATSIANSGDSGPGKPLQLLFLASFALVPAAFLLGLIRSRFFRAATVGRVIERLTLDPRTVRDALAAELGDPGLEVVYWVADGYVGRDGRPAALDGVVTEIEREGRRVGALVHSPELCEEPELLREATAAAALAIENARLEVELRARLEALRVSRARLVEAGDAERRRLGRDLHDGAQQRLVALMIELQLAREHFDKDPVAARELVDSAFANAQEAVTELRDLAAGIHPAVLSQRGLDAALESLASRAPVPVELDSVLDERLPSPVETAAYFVVAEALTNVAKYAGATHARVVVRRENGNAIVDVRDDGCGGADAASGSGLRGLGDRVGALDGTLEVRSPRGEGTLVRATFPV